MGIFEGNAQSYMASYNAVNQKIPTPCLRSMREIVEKEWKFDGMVCTDAGSLPNLTRQFKYYPDATAAVVGSVKAGITVFLDSYAAPLRDALEKKLLTEADVERNIRGNIRMRMRWRVRTRRDGALREDRWDRGTLVRREEPGAGRKSHSGIHRPAQEQRQLTALDKSKLRSIAVIGPFGDRVFIDSYAGIPPYAVTPLEGIRNKVGPSVRVRFVPNDTHSNAVNLAAESDVAIVFVGNHPTCYPQNERARRCPMRARGLGPQGHRPRPGAA